MEHLIVEVRGPSSRAPSLRLLRSDGSLIAERALSRQDLDELVAATQAIYGRPISDPRSLGERLYDWLDGPSERWLASQSAAQLVVHLDCEERLRHLPWELMVAGGGFVSVGTSGVVSPVRRVSGRRQTRAPQNRPLRVLFMATSPLDVIPELDFELEEGAILSAAAAQGIELVVEESGSLEGLRLLRDSFGDGYFDVIHLTGHAGIVDGQPVFVTENELGQRQDATAGDIAAALGGRFAPMVFVSGCSTGGPVAEGAIPSLAEALVEAGAPTVMGWALPVGDHAATVLAAELYRVLATGGGIDAAVLAARTRLHEAKSWYWHLLRVYSDATPLDALVTPPAHPSREQLTVRPAADVFLGPTGEQRVVAREGFVGRRRDLQTCLRLLRTPTGQAGAADVLVIQGTGGLGKTTLTSRLVERLAPTHRPAVVIGALDELPLRTALGQLDLPSIDAHKELNAILSTPDIALEDRLRYAFRGPLATSRTLLIFDDFENGNLEPHGATHRCTPEALGVLSATATAIRNTESRLVVTSRYKFPLPERLRVAWHPLGSLLSTALDKKLRTTINLGPTSQLEPELRTAAIEIAGGNPRLIEWLDLVMGTPGLDHPAILAALEEKAEEFRVDILARQLLAAQAATTRRVLALAAVFDIPVPEPAINAIAADHDDPAIHLQLGVGVGLIENHTDPTTPIAHYLVPSVVKPLLTDELDDDERRTAHRLAARSLYQQWISTDLPDGD